MRYETRGLSRDRSHSVGCQRSCWSAGRQQRGEQQWCSGFVYKPRASSSTGAAPHCKPARHASHAPNGWSAGGSTARCMEPGQAAAARRRRTAAASSRRPPGGAAAMAMGCALEKSGSAPLPGAGGVAASARAGSSPLASSSVSQLRSAAALASPLDAVADENAPALLSAAAVSDPDAADEIMAAESDTAIAARRRPELEGASGRAAAVVAAARRQPAGVSERENMRRRLHTEGLAVQSHARGVAACPAGQRDGSERAPGAGVGRPVSSEPHTCSNLWLVHCQGGRRSTI